MYNRHESRNSRITDTSEKLVRYIKRQLGEPVIRVEVPDESIEDIIYETVLKFTEYSWEGQLQKALVINQNGMGYYRFKEPVSEVFQVRTQSGVQGMNFQQNFGQGYVPDIWTNMVHNQASQGNITSQMVTMSTYSQLSEKYFVKEPLWDFSQGKNELHLLENYKGPILVQYQTVYEPDEEDMIYNHPWVKEYQVQRTKFLWGTITGKYSQSLVGGQQINYSDMKSEGESDMQRLHEELLSKYTDPQPIDIQ